MSHSRADLRPVSASDPRGPDRKVPESGTVGLILYAEWNTTSPTDIVKTVTEVAEVLRELAHDALPAAKTVAAVMTSQAGEASAEADNVRRAVLALAPDSSRSDEPVEDDAGLRIDRATHRVTVDGHEIQLTLREFQLLAFLARHPRQVFTRAELLRHVWELDYPGGTRTIDVHVRRLRSKLGEQAHRLSTVRGVGYRLEAARRERLLVS